jgi:hypothetical protein
MPGFLSAYEGTDRVDLGRGYWVDVKKCLSKKEYAAVENAIGGGRQRMEIAGRSQFATVDPAASRVEMVVASIVDWNLDDGDEIPWPLTPDKVKRANIGRLPSPVFDKIWKRCDDLNGQEAEADRVRFPDPGELGDPDGDGGAAGPAGLPDGTGVLAAPGPEPGSTGGPPAP